MRDLSDEPEEPDISTLPLAEQIEALQHMLMARATGGYIDDERYRLLRATVLGHPGLKPIVPRFLRTCRDSDHFWEFIKGKFGTYAERRSFLREELNPLIDAAEATITPSDNSTSDALREFSSDAVHEIWNRALERRTNDPEGAITLARTLLETVCKHVLDDLAVDYSDTWDLPKLYRTVSQELKFAPSQHEQPIFRQILGGCTAVVEGLGSLRNRMSDAHGTGKRPVRPALRHAHLAVNLAGTMATFIVETFLSRQQDSS